MPRAKLARALAIFPKTSSAKTNAASGGGQAGDSDVGDVVIGVVVARVVVVHPRMPPLHFPVLLDSSVNPKGQGPFL